METKLRLSIIAAMGVVNVVVLFGVTVTADQLAGINSALLAVAAAVLAWFSPSVPIGPKGP